MVMLAATQLLFGDHLYTYFFTKSRALVVELLLRLRYTPEYGSDFFVGGVLFHLYSWGRDWFLCRATYFLILFYERIY